MNGYVAVGTVIVSVTLVIAAPRATDIGNGVRPVISHGTISTQQVFSPYFLQVALPEQDGVSDTIAGAIYTPFAIAASLLTSAEVAASGPSPRSNRLIPRADEIYVVFRTFRPGVPHQFPDLSSAVPYAVAIPRGLFQLRGSVHPRWVKDGTEFFDTFGFAAPFPDTALIAAFPADTWTPEFDFALIRETRDGDVIRRQHIHGRIPRAIFPKWR